jgi:hypothetical protein
MMTREQKIERMIQSDIADIKQAIQADDMVFLTAVLSGNGWMPYNQLTDAQVDREYWAREYDAIEWPTAWTTDRRTT